MLPNVATCAHLKQMLQDVGNLWPLSENPVCPDPVWKPVTEALGYPLFQRLRRERAGGGDAPAGLRGPQAKAPARARRSASRRRRRRRPPLPRRPPPPRRGGPRDPPGRRPSRCRRRRRRSSRAATGRPARVGGPHSPRPKRSRTAAAGPQRTPWLRTKWGQH